MAELPLKQRLAVTPDCPGIYQMLAADGQILYIGKAKRLRRRLSSYFRPALDRAKTEHLMAEVVDFRYVVTETEIEALLLENTLIRRHKPRYNVVFRDDKTYPLIALSGHSEFPRLFSFRGRLRRQYRCFGPYPNVNDVNETVLFLQKVFKLRNCLDSQFKHRSRPCLQYQIKRCSAPCVGLISVEDYQAQVGGVVDILEGRHQAVIERWTQLMDEASAHQDYERAARYRDELYMLRRIQRQQVVDNKSAKDCDVIAVEQQGGRVCCHLLAFRNGRLLGDHSYVYPFYSGMSVANVLTEFMTQYYSTATINRGHQDKQANAKPYVGCPDSDAYVGCPDKANHSRQPIQSQQETAQHAYLGCPDKVIVSHALTDQAWVSGLLAHLTGRAKVQIVTRPRGVYRRWLDMALLNAHHAVLSQAKQAETRQTEWLALKALMGVEAPMAHVVCFDISHHHGGQTIGACVCFNAQGPYKPGYRRMHIKTAKAGDDYQAIRETVSRYLQHLQKREQPLPSVLLIDGGRGQLACALEVFTELTLTSPPATLAIAKGLGRKVGYERYFKATVSGDIHRLDDISPAAECLLQRCRDEAHRFAITGHRRRAADQLKKSPLEAIPGIGAAKRRLLLRHFGGMQALTEASRTDLEQVKGINRALAERILEHLRGAD